MSISARITYMQAKDILEEADPPSRPAPRTLPRERRLAGLVLAVAGLPLLTLALSAADDALSLEGELLLYLLAVVAVALVGGLIVALPAAVAAALLINFFFVAPRHTLDVARGEQALALGVFVAVAAAVSGAVELAARRARAAELAAAEAETLAALAGAELDEDDSLHAILDRARRTFGGVGRAARPRAQRGRVVRGRACGVGGARRRGAAALRRADRPHAAPGRARAGAVRRGPAGAAGVRRRGRDGGRGPPADRPGT
jgi:two-component system sensor histidine kinase KdpD